MVAPRIYFAVPEHYTIGTEYPTWDAALSAAADKIKPIIGCPGRFTRAFVDVRIKDETGDRPLHRVEILPGMVARQGSIEAV